ncbi:hypothetical protein HAX54_011226 [Datura stramonium]|uniref:Uncharacterized protein n=1 Tax=Datura stramonium TaxID=4076 RepID=A0ABS8TJC4_DATST|nr:hypothetical protein [Datura stramonium]
MSEGHDACGKDDHLNWNMCSVFGGNDMGVHQFKPHSSLKFKIMVMNFAFDFWPLWLTFSDDVGHPCKLIILNFSELYSSCDAPKFRRSRSASHRFLAVATSDYSTFSPTFHSRRWTPVKSSSKHRRFIFYLVNCGVSARGLYFADLQLRFAGLS